MVNPDLNLANETITDTQARQRDVTAVRRRLLVNATCPSVSAGQTSGTARMDNAARPRLADSAQRDYFTLRERVTTMQKQLVGVQDYIRT